MANKTNRFIGITLITLLGAVLFSAFSPVSYASDPDVTTGSAAAITNGSATFNGSIDANNLPTNVWFEYDTNRNLRNHFMVNAYYLSPGYDNDIFANVSGLAPNTTYYFRAVAQNTDGKDTGNIRSFTTGNSFVNYNYPTYSYPAYSYPEYSYPTYNYPTYSYPEYSYPAVNYSQSLSATTEPASLIGNTGVQLNSVIYNRVNDFSNTWFEYGTTPNLGSMTTRISTGIFPSARHVNTLNGLAPGTTYYFRAVAENYSSRSNGNILSFTTSGVKQNIQTSIITSTDTINTNTTTKTNTETNTPTIIIEKVNEIQPAQPVVTSSLPASVASADSFLPMSVFGWTLLIILVLVLMLMSKHLYLSFSSQKIDQTHIQR